MKPVHSISLVLVSLFVPFVSADAQSPVKPSNPRTIYKMVQPTAAYSVQRPQLTVGARITVFANFLESTPGVVLLDVAGTTTECQLIDWKPNSVTLQLPLFGVERPQDAQLCVVKPDGRVAKKLSVQMIGQPEIVVHSETIPQPMPMMPAAGPESTPPPASSTDVYAEPTGTGIVFYGSGV